MGYENSIKLDEFTVIGGNKFDLVFNVLDDLGIPEDITGYSASMKIAKCGDIRNLLEEITGIVDETEMTISFILTNTITSGFSGKYIYQIAITKPDTTKIVPRQGCFIVVSEIG